MISIFMGRPRPPQSVVFLVFGLVAQHTLLNHVTLTHCVAVCACALCVACVYVVWCVLACAQV